MLADAGVVDGPAAELGDVGTFAGKMTDALLGMHPGAMRPIHRITIARLMRDGGAAGILAALDTFREWAGRGESRHVALEAFVWALTRVAPPETLGTLSEDAAARAAMASARAAAVGADASLLERMADEREAFAAEAAGVDLAEEALARADADSLRALAARHGVHFTGAGRCTARAAVRFRSRATGDGVHTVGGHVTHGSMLPAVAGTAVASAGAALLCARLTGLPVSVGLLIELPAVAVAVAALTRVTGHRVGRRR